MQCLLFRFVLCVDSFGGTDGVAEKKDATTQLHDESRGIEEKDRIDFIVQFCCGPSQCMRVKEVQLVQRLVSGLDEDGAGSYAPILTKLSLDLVGIWAKS